MKKPSSWLHFKLKWVGTSRKREKFFFRSEPILSDLSERIPKKKARKLKNIILALFQAETGLDRLKKREIFFLIRNRFNPIRARKFLKKLKKLILASFQADTGWDRPKKREKSFLVRNRFYTTRVREFRKK